MTEIYLIRHAQAEGNLYRMMQGQWDGGVTPLGLRQIDCLAERFRKERLDAVYASDLYRARLTASALTRTHPALSLQPDPLFREINVGVWETQFFGDTAWAEPEKMYDFIRSPGKWSVPGSETYAQVQQRAFSRLKQLAQGHEGEAFAVVSHGVTIRCILAGVLNISLDHGESLPINGNTGVSKLLYENGTFTAVYMNDQSHLSGLAMQAWSHSFDVRTETLDPAADEAYYKSCYTDAWETAHGSLSGFSPEPYYRAALAHWKDDNRAVLRAYDKENPVGLLDLDPLRGAHAGYGWVSLLYIAPEYRRRGAGIQLLARALFFYESLGRRAVRLHCAADNIAALAFYRKHGFTALSEEKSGGAKILLLERKLGGERPDV